MNLLEKKLQTDFLKTLIVLFIVSIISIVWLIYSLRFLYPARVYKESIQIKENSKKIDNSWAPWAKAWFRLK